MTDRLTCCIPDCKRTMGVGRAARLFGMVPSEWVCAVHWGRLTKREKRVKRRLDRIFLRFGANEALVARERRVWAALKRRAAGDGA